LYQGRRERPSCCLRALLAGAGFALISLAHSYAALMDPVAVSSPGIAACHSKELKTARVFIGERLPGFANVA
jgi:hypothetical protein